MTWRRKALTGINSSARCELLSDKEAGAGCSRAYVQGPLRVHHDHSRGRYEHSEVGHGPPIIELDRVTCSAKCVVFSAAVKLKRCFAFYGAGGGARPSDGEVIPAEPDPSLPLPAAIISPAKTERTLASTHCLSLSVMMSASRHADAARLAAHAEGHHA